MTHDRKLPAPTEASIAAHALRNASAVEHAQAITHDAMGSVRESRYKGHHIVVRTRYEIEVDGKPVTGHLGVGNDGQVHYHPMPNVAFASAIDMVEHLIDIFPEDFGGPTRGAAEPAGGTVAPPPAAGAPAVHAHAPEPSPAPDAPASPRKPGKQEQS